jgi:hypothetical protein
MLNAVEFTTTESEMVIRVDKTKMDTATFEQLGAYFFSLVSHDDSVGAKPQTPHQRLTAGELRQLPKEQRNAILQAQVAMLQEYEIIEDDQDIIENDHESR